jgi:hypothetical protein
MYTPEYSITIAGNKHDHITHGSIGMHVPEHHHINNFVKENHVKLLNSGHCLANAGIDSSAKNHYVYGMPVKKQSQILLLIKIYP